MIIAQRLDLFLKEPAKAQNRVVALAALGTGRGSILEVLLVGTLSERLPTNLHL